MNKNVLSPFDCDLCAMVEDLTGNPITVDASPENFRLSWEQCPCDKTTPEGQKAEAIKQAVNGRLGTRAIMWDYKDGRQNVYVEYDPTEYPEEIRTRLYEADATAGTRYCRTLLEVDAIQVRRDNLTFLQKFTGGGTMTIPRTPDGRAVYSFPDGNGIFIDAPETWYIVREPNGRLTARPEREFSREFEPKEYERCENCEAEKPTEEMQHDREGVPLCPECIDALKGDPDFELVGVLKIKEERESQIYDHGFDVSHDRKNNKYGEIKQAVAAILNDDLDLFARTGWDYEFYHKIKAKPELEQLAICGALVAAEIDRLTTKN